MSNPNYMKCPGQNGQCGAVIPRRIVCTGANVGKVCRRCNKCEYFIWLPSDGSSPPSTSQPFLGSSAKTLQELLYDAVGMYQSSPAGQAAAAPPPSQPQAPPPTQPAPAALTQSTKNRHDRCKESGCTAYCTAAKCTTGLCAAHCKASGSQCGYSKHNVNNLRAVKPGSEPWELDRPVPSEPLFPAPDSPSLTGIADTPTVPPSSFVYRKPVPPEWAADYREQQERRKAADKSAQLRVEMERSLNHRVNIYVYTADDSEPDLVSYLVSTWPVLNLSNDHNLAETLGLPNVTGFRLYGEDLRHWFTNLNVPIKVSTNQVVAIAAPGVKSFLRLETLFRKGNRKRERSASPPASRKQSRTMVSPYLTPSPELSPLDISPIIDLTNAELDLQEEEKIQLPRVDRGKKWPQGMYARDMALGFRRIAVAQRQHDKKIQVAFEEVFAGNRFVHSTYYLHRASWDRLSDKQRDTAASLPRSEKYLWSRWCKSLSVV